MDEEISYCGLRCIRCPIYTVAREKDKRKKDALISEIIKTCKTLYGAEYKYNDITGCDGCKSETGILFSGCLYCKIRICASAKGIENCAYCEEYTCKELSNFFQADKEAKTALDNIRKTIA